MFVLCILLHLIIVGTHVALIVVDFKHQQFLANETLATDLIFLAVVMGSSAVVKTFLVVVLTFTQGLALKRNYHVRQSLTALHEKSSAWLGLGPSLTVMWRQRRHRAARLGAFLILGYLATMFALGITDAALLTVGYADVNDPILAHTTAYLSEVQTGDLEEAFPIVNILPVWDYVLTLGFDDSTVYDIPNLGGKGDASVDAIVFSVDCSAIPALSQSGSPTTMTVNGNRLVGFPVHVGSDLQDIVITPAPRSLRVLSPQPVNIQETGLPPTLFVVSTTVQIVDDGNSALSVVDINPSVQGNASGCGNNPCAPVSSVQVVACNVQASNTTVKIEADEGDLEVSSGSQDVSWHSWSLPNAPSQPFLQPVGDFGSLSPLSDSVQTYSTTLNGSVVISTYNATMLEDSLMDWLSYYDTAPTLSLGMLNYALQQALAAVYWRASFRLAARATGGPNAGNIRFQVQINKYTPWIGLGLSTVLLLLAVILTRQPMRSPPELDAIGSPGVLQLAWLMGKAEHLPRDLNEKVSNPILEDLLKAGKDLEVTMREHIEIGCTDRPHSGAMSGLSDLGPDELDDKPSVHKEGEVHAADDDQKQDAEKARDIA
ncbi:hypothetical protein NM688_g1043 [Phlebia brevispora]|uniref:Uncharacterized protein n=1 Tax=Phlebia brevispora TaxID=194682 RepID=A0ACC1TCR8_9APHY|nr:hypothetical protein NM688_g1043 [Phlebia brevispora]